MAWMASNIYIEHDDDGQVADAIERLLCRGEGLRDREGILDAPRPILVTPPLGGWVAVARLGPWLEDVPLAAAALAADTGAHAVSLEMIGNSYRMRLCEYRGDESVGEERTPEHGWNGELDEPPQMPLYEDAEARAYGALVELGVPRTLITVGAAPLGHDEVPAEELGDAVRLTLDDGQVRQERGPLSAAPFSGDAPPVLPTNITRDFGEMLFEERYVEGDPAPEALVRLLEIEDTLAERARRAAPRKDVSLTVTYYAAAHQEKLNALLHRRDRLNLTKDQHLKRSPWWTFWRFFGKFK